MLHHLKRHGPKDGSKLVDALRPEGFGEGRQVMDERERSEENRENIQEADR